MDIIEFYEKVLASVWVIDQAGAGQLTSIYRPDKPENVTIGGKRLTLPLKDVLRAGKKEDQIIFHPASENVTRAESDVIKQLRDLTQLRGQYVIGGLVEALGRVAATPSLHKGLGKAGKYLLNVPEFDEKAYLALQGIIKRQSPDPDRRVLSINLRQGSKTKDDGVVRSTLISFPIFDDLERDTDLDVFGKALPSKKAKSRVHKLFEVVCGDKETRESFSFGSRNMDAPYLHSLLTAYSRLMTHLNEIVETHTKLLGPDDAALLHTDLSWVEGLEELGRYRAAVPPQTGNEGAIKVTSKEHARNAGSVTEKVRDVLAPPADRGSREELPWEGEYEPTPVTSTNDRSRAPSRSPSREPAPASSSGSLADYNNKMRGGGAERTTERDRGGIFRTDRTSRPSLGGGTGFRPSGSSLRGSGRRSF